MFHLAIHVPNKSPKEKFNAHTSIIQTIVSLTQYLFANSMRYKAMLSPNQSLQLIYICSLIMNLLDLFTLWFAKLPWWRPDPPKWAKIYRPGLEDRPNRPPQISYLGNGWTKLSFLLYLVCVWFDPLVTETREVDTLFGIFFRFRHTRSHSMQHW